MSVLAPGAPGTPAGPGTRGRDRAGTGAAAGVLLLAAGLTAAGIAAVSWVAARTGSAWAPGGDLAVYRDAAAAVLAGGSPYEVDRGGYAFVYPPFAALVLTPLAALGPVAGYWAWTLLSALAVPVVVWLAVDQLAPACGRSRTLLVAAGTLAVLPLSPIAGTLLLGNVNVLLVALVLVDLLRVRGRYAGVLTGIAAGIKLTPLIFVGYLLLTGRIRAGVTALASFLGTVAVGFLLLPGPSAAFWGGAFADGSRTRPPGEEAVGSSVRGVVLNLLPEPLWPLWLPASLLVGALGLAVAVRASRRRMELTGIVACAVTGLLVSPVTWYAHWVWCVPVLALLAARTGWASWRARALLGGAWLVFALPLPWWIAYVLGWVPASERAWVRPVELLYSLTGAALLVLAAAWLRRPAPAPEPDTETGVETGAGSGTGADAEPVSARPADAAIDAVAVIVPNYNKSKTLAACLDAIYAQTHPPTEVIVVDDHSTDDSPDIARQYPCTLIQQPTNQGPAAARNTGAHHSTAPLLFFVDSDTAPAPDAIANALHILHTTPHTGMVQGIYAPHPLYDDGPVEAYRVAFEHFWRKRSVGRSRAATLFAASLVPRAVFDEVGGFDERLRTGEDAEFGTRMPERYRLVVTDTVVTRHDDVDRFLPFVREQFGFATQTPLVMLRAGRRRNAGTGLRVNAFSPTGLVLSGLSLLALPLLPLLPWLLPLWLALLAGSAATSHAFLRFTYRFRGAGFAAYATGMHLLLYALAVVGTGVGTLRVAYVLARGWAR
ncbi:glycosyltransferase 87 family protein [Micromonospora sp. NPDC049559]|uniref:glycosyltransferase 87 family protein n=1 Tax=Micromonospora sp. NPDC049559 TaxID=3155923 RepID=UPI003432658F